VSTAPVGQPVTSGGARPVTMRVVGSRSVRTFAGSGLRVRLQCVGSCKLTARLTVSKGTARALRTRTVLAGAREPCGVPAT
jgi:hypothetical protein